MARRSSCRDGRLPAALIAGNPEFLRPLVGVAPPGGAHLRFYAVDVGRGADGRWWVLGDRAQAPSGAGYAIENRLALSRAIPDIYRTTRVERLAPFFQAFQAELSALSRQDDARICLLTPGPMNETYFEHAYLARYLGFLLVEGEDLIVRDDGVFIRTVSGLQRAEVLLRRLDADFADPLELNAARASASPGLVQAVRDGKVVIVNSLGAGLVEARAMLAFLPALAPIVLGADLAIPNVATWWLGRADMREEMIDKLDTHGDRVGLSSRSLPARGASEVLGAKLDDAQRQALIRSIRDRGIDYVVQEAVTLSSMPVWRDGRLQPRPFTLRLFLAKVGDRWQVMPGGFVRIADNADARAVSLQRGAATADAWVLSHGPVARDDAAAGAGADRGPARHRLAAEPRRRQSVLGRPLRGARRGDAAAGARPDQPDRRGRRGGGAGHRRIWVAAAGLERGAERNQRRRGRLDRARRAHPRRLAGSLPSPRRRRAFGRVGDPRSLLARRLAGAQRSRRHHRHAAGRSAPRKAPCSSASRRRCASSRRSRVWRRRT